MWPETEVSRTLQPSFCALTSEDRRQPFCASDVFHRGAFQNGLSCAFQLGDSLPGLVFRCRRSTLGWYRTVGERHRKYRLKPDCWGAGLLLSLPYWLLLYGNRGRQRQGVYAESSEDPPGKAAALRTHPHHVQRQFLGLRVHGAGSTDRIPTVDAAIPLRCAEKADAWISTGRSISSALHNGDKGPGRSPNYSAARAPTSSCMT